MKSKLVWMLLVSCLWLTACQPAEAICDEDTIRYVDSVDQLPPLTESADGSRPSPGEIEIKGKLTHFDDVISGPLCNNHLSGKVYITCDLEIVAWDTAPNFLDGCDFQVEPGSEITVASHNNAVYYKGCGSCHISNP